MQLRVNGMEFRLTLEMQKMVKMHEKLLFGSKKEIDSRILQMNEVLQKNGQCMEVHKRALDEHVSALEDQVKQAFGQPERRMLSITDSLIDMQREAGKIRQEQEVAWEDKAKAADERMAAMLTDITARQRHCGRQEEGSRAGIDRRIEARSSSP